MRGDILGAERRRRWSDEDKLAIVTAVGVDGASVTQVAQRHDITRQQIYTWRHELRKKGLLSAACDTLFLPVELDRKRRVIALVDVVFCFFEKEPSSYGGFLWMIRYKIT